MAVLFAEGFTGAPVTTGLTAGASWEWGPNNGIVSLGWQLNAFYNGTVGTIGLTDNNVIASVEPDPIFADRRQLRLSKNLSASTITLIQQAIMPLTRASEFQKIVIGMTATLDSTSGTNGNTWLYIGSQEIVPSSTLTLAQWAARDGAIALIRMPLTAGNGDAYFPQTQSAAAVAIPNLAKGTFAHIEVLIEKGVPRTRVYVDGSLVSDAPRVPSTFTGFTVGQWISAGAAGVHNAKYSNIYVLGIDGIHTGKLGPAARVLETPPPGDIDVSWQRPDSYATNAEVLGQMFNQQSPAYLAAKKVGDYDLYKAPSAVAANAAQIYGAGFRINAMTMAAGTHTIRPVVKTATSAVTEVGNEVTLQLGTLTPYFVDASANPDTGALWTPSAVTASGFGIKLKS